MSSRKNLVGQRFGSLVVKSIGQAIYYPRSKTFKWWCQCDCGVWKEVLGQSLRRGATTSCGDLSKHRRPPTLRQQYPHEYYAWLAIWQRCTKPKCPAYQWYGAKGVTVDPRWKRFDVFFADVGARPGSEYSLDRYPNLFGNYEPGNVRWATHTEQNRNMRSNIFLTYNGMRLCLTDWAHYLGLPRSTLKQRYDANWPIDDIFSTKRFTSRHRPIST